MKKIIFTILLTIVSSVWTTSMALCLSPIPDAVYQPFATVSGTFVSVPIPCEPIDEYPCPTCLTLALQTSDRLYYLTADNSDIQTQLEAIEYQLSLTTNITGSVSGTPYTEESYEYIRVQAVDTNSAPLRLPSLCDEWNVWYESFQSFGPINYNAVIKYRLATDTMINGQRYVQLAYDNSPYMEGALREGSNRDIYYIPSRSTHEYLLYAFNAQVGDTITNLYVGAMGKEEGYQAVVRAISDSNPRIFTVGVNIDEYTEYPIKWIEGVGSPETPYGLAVVPTVPADPGVYSLLCAYKNGEQVYVSEMGEQYGCVREDFIEGEFVTLNGHRVESFRECSIDGCPTCFGSFMTQDASIYSLTATDTLIMEQLNMLRLGKQVTIKGVWTKCKNIPFIEVNAIYETKDTIPSDTIPLYIKDGPGSSTIEPVDPNEIIAKLIHDELQMKEYLHTIIDYNLTKAPAANSSPAVKHVNPVVAADSFTDSETVTLTESGRYFLEMSHPDWDYTIVGTFVYNARQGLETIENSQSACTKELREGQLLIRQGEQLYTPTGIRIQ